MSNRHIQQNLETVQERIVQAAERAHRDPKDVKLIVVTKAHPAQILQEVISAGATRLGENYPEEAATKMEALQFSGTIEWHMLGPIQSRKAGLVAEKFSYIHSLARTKVARKLDQRAAALGKQLSVLVQVNVSGEASKSGLPAWDETNLAELFQFVSELAQLSNLRIQGLMTVPPYDPDPEISRPFFARLNKIRDILANKYSSESWDELSIGMSGDYEVAIEEGATFVRVGTAIVGSRR